MNWSTHDMMTRLLLSSPQKAFGMTLATVARQKAETSAVEHAMFVKHACSVELSFLGPVAESLSFGLSVEGPLFSESGRALHFFHSGFDDNGRVCRVSKVVVQD